MNAIPTPTAAPASSASPASPQTPRPKWPMISMTIVGGLVLAAGVGTAAIAGLVSLGNSSHTDTQRLSADLSGVRAIDLEASAAGVTVRCDGRVPDTASLLVDGGSRTTWTMRVDGDTLRVQPERPFGSFTFGWFNAPSHLDGTRPNEQVSLTLPAEACGDRPELTAEFEVGAGMLDVEGDFAELDVEVGTGAYFGKGTVHRISTSVGVGEATLELTDVEHAELEVSVGSLTGSFAGAAPREVDIEVSVGELNLQLPEAIYQVTSRVSAGDFTNALRSTKEASDHRIRVEVSVGDVTLR